MDVFSPSRLSTGIQVERISSREPSCSEQRISSIAFNLPDYGNAGTQETIASKQQNYRDTESNNPLASKV